MLSHSVVSNSLQSHGLYPAGLLCPWDFPGKNTRVSGHCYSLRKANLVETFMGNEEVKKRAEEINAKEYK